MGVAPGEATLASGPIGAACVARRDVVSARIARGDQRDRSAMSDTFPLMMVTITTRPSSRMYCQRSPW